MQTWTFKLPVFLVLLFFPCTCLVLCQERDMMEETRQSTKQVMDTIDAGVRAWRDEIDFVMDFRYQQGTAESIEKALKGEFIGKSKSGDQADCRVAKWGNAVRYEFRIIGAPHVNRVDAVSSISTWSSFELVASENLEFYRGVIHEVAQDVPMGGTAGFAQVEKDQPELLHRESDLTRVGPLSVTGGNRGSILASLADSAEFAFNHEIKDKTIAIHAQTQGEEERIGYTYQFDVSGRFPMLTSVELNQQPILVLSDLVDIGSDGCKFPGRILSITGPAKILNSEQEVWIARIWTAVGAAKSPERSDFDINLEGARVLGISEPMIERKSLNFLDLTSDDFREGTNQESDQDLLDQSYSAAQSMPLSPTINWQTRMAWLGIVVVVVGVFGYLFLSRRGGTVANQ